LLNPKQNITTLEPTDPQVSVKEGTLIRQASGDVTIVFPIGISKEESKQTPFPAELVVTQGDTVTWRNDDIQAHTVTSGFSQQPEFVGQLFDSGIIAAGNSFSHTFSDKSITSYHYFCGIHPWMTGEVLVQHPESEYSDLTKDLNMVEKIYPQATTIIGKVSTIQETKLKTIASSEESETIDRSTGISKSKFESGSALLELHHGIAPDGNDIIAATITNNGVETFYLGNLVIFGQTSEKIEPLNAYLVDGSYSPEFFGNIPKPAVVSPVLIAPGDSYSGFISGKWNVANQPVESFSVGAVYTYDIGSTGFVQDNTWSISVASTKLP
jgi:plastocyanin